MQFRHYKGGIYDFVCAAKLESNPETVMIVYTAADGSFWTRPEEVFFEMIEHDGKTVQRFIAIDA
ncbi:DUF1653 domain-containing protein [Herminiimonas fonticola]|uniref:Uncharacterized protein DUF1653 n=1 Tax=Herminiimonas fonticola TaxID=303380 RepID=A0A4R6GFK1_9BURK|nr:DUF1653 domain-containing protein [Herminiimonas fonticola]RBA24519.1 hypothetical protein Hfont_0152 [Herminiimonas fonticola]TDN93636.1 uncharacterized protein DUF1653 [Herminiimonas fonticola]